MLNTKHAGLAEGYLMSQYDVGIVLGLNQRTVSKAESSMLKKMRAILSRHEVSEQEFLQYLRYQEL